MLLMLNLALGSIQYQLSKSSVWLGWESNSRHSTLGSLHSTDSVSTSGEACSARQGRTKHCIHWANFRATPTTRLLSHQKHCFSLITSPMLHIDTSVASISDLLGIWLWSAVDILIQTYISTQQVALSAAAESVKDRCRMREIVGSNTCSSQANDL